MVDNVISVNWKEKLLGIPPKAGWDVSGNLSYRGLIEPDQLLLSALKLRRIPRKLRDPNLIGRFQELIQGTSFSSWWDQVCGAPDDKFFALNFPNKAWSIPWELLIERLIITGQHDTVSIIRNPPEVMLPEVPNIYNEPMRSVILLGDDGSSIGLPRLDLKGEVKGICDAWHGLDKCFQQCVMRPITINAIYSDVIRGIQDIKPHVIWYSGHGITNPETELIFVGGERINAKQFTELITDSERVPAPVYAIFWACNTGAPESRVDTFQITPPFCGELIRAGVLSILAMQSPIRDVSARVMAAELFRHLATGKSLELSLARTRALVLDNLRETIPGNNGVTGFHRLDWASPVIWSGARKPVKNLEWNAVQQHVAIFHMAGRWALQLPLDSPSALIDPP